MNQLEGGPFTISPAGPGAAAEGSIILSIFGVLVIAHTPVSVDYPIHPVAEAVTQVDRIGGVVQTTGPVSDDVFNPRVVG